MAVADGVKPPVLAVDPGEARIGLAVSDPTGTIARPLEVLHHVSRDKDADAILRIADEQGVASIVVGLALDQEGRIGPQARRALRLADVLRQRSSRPVETWDESGSTRIAQEDRGSKAMLDARAAAVILQEFLDAQSPP